MPTKTNHFVDKGRGYSQSNSANYCNHFSYSQSSSANNSEICSYSQSNSANYGKGYSANYGRTDHGKSYSYPQSSSAKYIVIIRPWLVTISIVTSHKKSFRLLKSSKNPQL